MNDHRLVLYPGNIDVTLNRQSLIQALRGIGLAGEEHAWQGELHYLPGERFLEMITFLGCSPHIHLAPPEDDSLGSEYCHIGLSGFGDQPRFFGGDNVRTPPCPYCKQPLQDWREALADTDNFHCGQCGEKLSLAELNWRRSAAYASCALQIWGVHDGEAVPAEALLTMLQQLSGSKWGYFYRQSR